MEQTPGRPGSDKTALVAEAFDGEVTYEPRWIPCEVWLKRKRKVNPWKDPKPDPYGIMLGVKATVDRVACVPQGSEFAIVFKRSQLEVTDAPMNPVRTWIGVIEEER